MIIYALAGSMIIYVYKQVPWLSILEAGSMNIYV